ncbi:MAG TPA: hypothetical protein DEG17_11365 [Cyanobacteria bacterium UBA11149]|nr:hypothetical protein [Cyanobacteria bacterium UBA11367]HBE57447.1 hypothetical protein [Cyanobacteria bacterium UBA11366]HBK66075.1 hypothetical protein [Cyanobacteria bacterium UBA11166]HBR76786.1 hypothetical protein [Cyanobacteria bacterium UBA11159]HBS71523.1 hypothetical protein [Cyanobacteria bacterium UBA11153]HBW89445.1 hypothetical protein [Cyanobacteria bacterium UBA11149]HCA97372.1 hypothetical protein [Cyanobacteria bacterium UBA9226]
MIFYIYFKLYSIPDWHSRAGTLQANPELRKHIKALGKNLQFLFVIETILIWLSLLLNLFFKHIFARNCYSKLVAKNICIGLLFTVFIFLLWIYTTVPIMMICDYPYC